MDSGDEKQETEEDGSDLRQGGRGQSDPDGGKSDGRGKVEDVYVTVHGRVLRRDAKLKSCGVTDGCTIQVASRLRGGGKHKDRKGQKERK